VSDAGTVPLVESHPEHPDRKAPDEIAPNPEHGGLRVKTVAPKGTELVHGHPATVVRQHPQNESLAGLSGKSDGEKQA
jgi:hypothetical protein